jgi:phosphomannomutase
MSALKAALPQFEMAKSKIELEEGMNVDALLHQMYIKYKNVEQCNIIDGLKIDFADSWVHLRKSNTEPIIRIYSEANISAQAESLAARFIQELRIEAQGN